MVHYRVQDLGVSARVIKELRVELSRRAGVWGFGVRGYGVWVHRGVEVWGLEVCTSRGL